MDVQKVIKKYVKKINSQHLSGNVSIINETRFNTLISKVINKELAKIQKEKDRLGNEIIGLNAAIATQKQHIENLTRQPPKTEVDIEGIIAGIASKIDAMKEELKEEIQRQVAFTTATSKAGMGDVDIQAFMDRLFEGEDLETNVEVVKEVKRNMDKSGIIDKLRNMKDQ